MSEEFWKNEFGNSYHARNRVDWRKRIKFWGQILDLTGARSVWEWGCGPGWNLTAIEAAAMSGLNPMMVADGEGAFHPISGSSVQWPIQVYGTECNETAIVQAQSACLDVSPEMPSDYDTFELTCTVGALIHVEPDYVEDMMQKIIDASSDYVLAVEYAAQKESMVNYRGHDDKLWCRPYGQMYQHMGLKMVAEGDAGDGFDDCRFSLLRKPT